MCTSCADYYWRDVDSFICYPCSGNSPSKLLFWYVLKVIVFALFCYWVSLLLFRSFEKQNQESIAAIRIWLTML